MGPSPDRHKLHVSGGECCITIILAVHICPCCIPSDGQRCAWNDVLHVWHDQDAFGFAGWHANAEFNCEQPLTSSATVATMSKPTKEKYTIAAPAKMPGMPCGAKGVRLSLWPKGAPAMTTYRIAIRFIPVTTAAGIQPLVCKGLCTSVVTVLRTDVGGAPYHMQSSRTRERAASFGPTFSFNRSCYISECADSISNNKQIMQTWQCPVLHMSGTESQQLACIEGGTFFCAQ